MNLNDFTCTVHLAGLATNSRFSKVTTTTAEDSVMALGL